MSVEKEEEVASYVRLRDQLTNLGGEFHKILTDPQYIVRFMNSGRLVKIKNQDQVCKVWIFYVPPPSSLTKIYSAPVVYYS